jgi:hypothetical protein
VAGTFSVGTSVLAWDGARIWAVTYPNDGSGQVTELNPDGSVASTIPAGQNPPTSIASHGTHIWAANPKPSGNTTQNGTETVLATS